MRASLWLVMLLVLPLAACSSAGAAMEIVLGVGRALVEHPDDFTAAVLLRDENPELAEHALDEMGEYGVYIELSLELLDELQAALEELDLTPRKVGWVSGRIAGEVGIGVAFAAATGGTSAVASGTGRAAKIGRAIEKITRLGDRASLESILGRNHGLRADQLDAPSPPGSAPRSP